MTDRPSGPADRPAPDRDAAGDRRTGDDRPPLRLTARDAEDLAIVSAMLQDAICAPSDMGFAARDGLFALAVNRFRWEAAAGPERLAVGDDAPDDGADDGADERAHDGADDAAPVYQRTQCGVRFLEVRRAATSGFRLTDRGRLLSLLAVTAETKTDGKGVTLMLTFAGGPRLRLEADAIHVAVEDFGDAWPTARRPRHEIEDGGESD